MFNFPQLLGPYYAALVAAAALPLLIHLINMLRHRRVEWAAMEFLLQSHKKNRTWVRLKQLLLLLARIAALTAIVLMVAQPLLRHRLGGWFSGMTTHHIVLLDDSFSMSDRWADTSAFAEAKKAIKRLGDKAAEQVESQAMTLIRFSKVGRAERDSQIDLQRERVNRRFGEKLSETLDKMQVSQTAAGPLEALRAIGQMLDEGGAERRIVYLFTDFRNRDWSDPAEAGKVLSELRRQDAEIHLVNCVDKRRPNLAIASLEPARGIHAAGVDFFMEVTVQNFDATPAKEVQVVLEEDGHARPALTIAQAPPGRAVKERFQVNFPTAGEHQITARLEGDAVAADNIRYSLINLPTEVPVLLVDGAPSPRDARFLSVACAPGGPVRTGIHPQIEQPRFLATKPLDKFQAITLLNVDYLDKSAVEALERFAAAGGGVAFFLGERSQAKFINEQLYRDGEGLFPLPLKGAAELPVDRLERAPDIEVEARDHFVFRVFADARNPFLSSVGVQRYFAAADGWQPKPDSSVETLARLRNGAPLVVERSFGKGRIIAVLTTAAPDWNTWALNPSFVVAVQDLHAYLASRPVLDTSRQVGTPLEVHLDPAEYQPEVRFFPPAEAAGGTPTMHATTGEGGALRAAFRETDQSGIYQARLMKTDGTSETRRWAFNVDADEGDLTTVSRADLAAKLEGFKDYIYEQVEMFQYAASEMAGYNLSRSLLYFLIVLLIAEQLLAWSASYHPAARSAGARGGRR